MKNRSISAISIFGILIILWPSSCPAFPPEKMASQHAKELKKWLDSNKEYRLATFDDCNCLEEVKQMRRGDKSMGSDSIDS